LLVEVTFCEVSCRACGLRRTFPQYAWFTLSPEGEEVAFRHPSDWRQVAHDDRQGLPETRRAWSRAGRLYGKRPGVCRKCGVIELYRNVDDAICCACEEAKVLPLGSPHAAILAPLGVPFLAAVVGLWGFAAVSTALATAWVGIAGYRNRAHRRALASIRCEACSGLGLTMAAS